MAFTIENFRQQILGTNVARTAHYEVLIMPPDDLRSSQYANQGITSLLCASAHTPGLNLFTDDNYTENGIRRAPVYDVNYQNLTLEFIVDSEYRTKYFFDDWFKLINPERRIFAYASEYTADKLYLNLLKPATDSKSAYGYVFKNIFPKNVNTINYNSASGSMATFSVDFSYETFDYYKPR